MKNCFLRVFLLAGMAGVGLGLPCPGECPAGLVQLACSCVACPASAQWIPLGLGALLAVLVLALRCASSGAVLIRGAVAVLVFTQGVALVATGPSIPWPSPALPAAAQALSLSPRSFFVECPGAKHPLNSTANATITTTTTTTTSTNGALNATHGALDSSVFLAQGSSKGRAPVFSRVWAVGLVIPAVCAVGLGALLTVEYFAVTVIRGLAFRRHKAAFGRAAALLAAVLHWPFAEAMMAALRCQGGLFKGSLEADPRVACTGQAHTAMVAVSLIALAGYSAALPCVLWWAAVRRRTAKTVARTAAPPDLGESQHQSEQDKVAADGVAGNRLGGAAHGSGEQQLQNRAEQQGLGEAGVLPTGSLPHMVHQSGGTFAGAAGASSSSSSSSASSSSSSSPPPLVQAVSEPGSAYRTEPTGAPGSPTRPGRRPAAPISARDAALEAMWLPLRPGCESWAAGKMLLRLVLSSAVTALAPLGVYVQESALGLLCVASLAATLAVRPYNCPRLNRLDAILEGCVALVALAAMGVAGSMAGQTEQQQQQQPSLARHAPVPAQVLSIVAAIAWFAGLAAILLVCAEDLGWWSWAWCCPCAGPKQATTTQRSAGQLRRVPAAASSAGAFSAMPEEDAIAPTQGAGNPSLQGPPALSPAAQVRRNLETSRESTPKSSSGSSSTPTSSLLQGGTGGAVNPTVPPRAVSMVREYSPPPVVHRRIVAIKGEEIGSIGKPKKPLDPAFSPAAADGPLTLF